MHCVVDKDVDVQNEAEVAAVRGTHVDPLRDIEITKGPVDDLDDASIFPAYGGRWASTRRASGRPKASRREFPKGW